MGEVRLLPHFLRRLILKSNINTLLLLLIGIFTIVFITSCDSIKYEINTEIYPSYILPQDIEDEDDVIIGLEYRLGPVLILDEIEVTPVQFRYIRKKSKNQKLKVRIIYADFSSSESGFYYYLEGVRFGKEETEPVDFKELSQHSDNIPGFVWFIKDSKKVEDEPSSSSFRTPLLKKLE